jgi:hypothetical protein
MQPFHARCLPGDERHRPLRHAERFRHERDQRRVRRAVDRRRGKPRGEMLGRPRAQGIAPAARRDADRDDQPVADDAPGINSRW